VSNDMSFLVPTAKDSAVAHGRKGARGEKEEEEEEEEPFWKVSHIHACAHIRSCAQ